MTRVTRSVAQIVRVHEAEIIDNLPRPEYRWRWVECDLHQSIKQRLMDEGLIKRSSEDRDRWRTSQQLWRYVVDRIDVDDEEIGERVGYRPISDWSDNRQKIHQR